MRTAHRLSGGVPRLLNTICDRALLGAYATGQPRVKDAVIRRAAREVLGRRRGRRWKVATATAALLVVAGGVALLAWGGLPSLGAWPLPRVGTTPSTPSAAALGVAASQPSSQGPTLATILGDPSLTGDRARAFTNLYALWSVDVRPGSADPGCDAGRAAGLRCLSRTGTWTVLRRLNLPAILELTTPDGQKHHVVLTALAGERGTLEIGSRRVTPSSVAVERFWDGAFVMIWQSPVTGPLPLQPGMGGRDVAWLRQRLGALDGQPNAAKANQIYDRSEERRVGKECR